MAAFVMVHGGGHGGWCFQPVADLLRGRGHEVHAPSLTGLADRKHLLGPDVGLDTHITDIANLLDYEDLQEVILVGHSYGGMVITGAADRSPRRIAGLVYLDAAIPHHGEALLDVSPGLQAFAAANQTVDGVELGLWPDAAAVSIYGLANCSLKDWAGQRLTPHPWKCFTDRLVLQDEQKVRAMPRTIINCTSTLAHRPAAIKSRWFTAERVWEIDTGHDLMLTQPDAVAEMLARVAGG
jgi:pimeloyl-ACP methyl ester carboxylesterase